ncbi:glutamate--tRNA ligase [Candidatus Shikimatogenerans bostrichidophilus]|uniref:glutamate--tRNA ligase n=1 Tax=Candidatus Shikimatogenerans bostrichidophilus TaxID=2943807 RepID=UPI002966477A
MKYKLNKYIRVRFAPSPTGPLHIGGLRTALFNYIYAKKNNGKFILRIDDTDKKRFIKNSINYLIDSLKWCNIKYDEGYGKKGKYKPYIQSKRLKIYKKYINKLIKNKLAYYAFDKKKTLNLYKKKYKYFIYNCLTRKYLNNSLNINNKKIIKLIKNNKYVIRLKTPYNKIITFYDKIYGKISINTNKLDDKIIYRSNNTPTYHFANVIDDHLMNITHVIRGKEWLSSTPLHIIIYNYFNWKTPKFVHLPLILNKKGKISKRNLNNNNIPIFPIKSNYKNINVKNSYEELGFLPEALINIMALLGWQPNINNEIFNINTIIKLFTLKDINKSDVHLNFKKSCWINHKYININKINNNKKIFNLLKKFLIYSHIYTNDKLLNKIINLIVNRIKLININEIWYNSYYFFIIPKKFYIPLNIKKYIISNKKKIINYFFKLNCFFKKNPNKKQIILFFKNLQNNNNDYYLFLKIIRILIIGELKGISLFDIFYILNYKNIIFRINNFKYIILNYYK